MNRKNIVRIVITVFCLLIPATGSVAAKTLKISVDRWPPYENISDTRSPGFSTEVVRHVFGKMGIDTEIKEYPWVRALNYVYKGRTDALFSAFFNEERAQHCYYPDEPLVVAKYVLLIRAEDAGRLRFDSCQLPKTKAFGLADPAR